MNEEIILRAISFTESCSFGEMCRGLGDEKPERGDRAGWRQLFLQLEKLEADGLVEISRLGKDIDTLQLTEAGAARARAADRR
jgi:hypothetical protein